MRKFIFLTLLVCGMCTLAYAGPYYSGLNQLNNLIRSIDGDVLDTDGKALDLDGYEPATDDDGNPVYNLDGTPKLNYNFPRVNNNDSNEDFDKLWGTIAGITWSESVHLDYRPADDPNYRVITDIDFSNVGYVQKEGTSITLIQPDIDPNFREPTDLAQDDPIRIAASQKLADWERNDVAYIESLDFSGNDFTNVTIDGLENVEYIDFSNNPNLSNLVIKNCPWLDYTYIQNTKLPLYQIFDIKNGLDELTQEFTYAPQAILTYEMELDKVDLSKDYSLGGTLTTFEWSVEPESTDNGMFVFADEHKGKKVTCKLTNAALPDFGTDGRVYEINLKERNFNSISTANADALKVWGDNGRLFIDSKDSGFVTVYNTVGTVVTKQRINQGLNEIPLFSSIYLVKFDNGFVKKVIVK